MTKTREISDLLDGVTINGDITLEDADAGSAAGPELILYRNSPSPADGDYLGQIKFNGENDTGGNTLYGKITGKTSDVTNGSEDGLIETAVKKAGSNVIVSRQTGDALKLINGTGLEVDADLTVDTNTLYVDSTNNRVGIGTTSPASPLHVQADGIGIRLDGSADTSREIFFRSTSSSNPAAIHSDGALKLRAEDAGTHMEFHTADTERMRIDSSGNIQIGSTNSGVAGSLDVSIGSTSASGGITLFSPTNGTHSIGFADGTSGTDRYRGYIEYQHSNDALAFATAATERLRIDSSGNLLVGKTSADFGATVGMEMRTNDTLYVARSGGASLALNRTSSDGAIAEFRKDNSTVGTIGSYSGTGLTIASGGELRFFTSTSNEDMRLETDGDLHVDGNVVAYSTTISDIRLKKDIAPIENAVYKVNQLNGCTFTYLKDDRKSAGLIAQDVEKVLPSAVIEDEAVFHGEEGETYKTVQYDQVIGLLVEAVKELSARVEELENGSS